MFTRLSTAFVLVSAICATASPAAVVPRTDAGHCNTGPVQCCQHTQNTVDPVTSTLAGLLGIALGSIDLPLGINCTPISVIGIGGNSCTAQPVCCSKNNFNGLVALGCNPINVNL